MASVTDIVFSIKMDGDKIVIDGLKKVQRETDENPKKINNWSKLGVRSTKAIKKEIKDLENAYEELKKEGKASAEDLARAEKALIKKTKELEKEMGKLTQKTNNWSKLGVRSTKAIEKEIKDLEQAYKELADSGTANIKDLARAEKALIKKTKELENEMKGIDDTPKKSGGGLGAALGGYAMAANVAVGAIREVGQAVGAVVQQAAGVEQTRIALNTIAGDMNTAGNIMERLTKFAAKTPFKFPELANATKNLMAFGFGADESLMTIENLGDIAAGVGADIGELSFALGQIQTKGKADTESLNKFAERGIPIYDELANVMGASGDELRKMISSGKIGLPDVQKALSNMTAEGGKFYGMMEKQSNSMSGLLSTLRDNWGVLLNSIIGVNERGEIQENSIFSDIKEAVSELIVIIQENKDTIVKTVRVVIEVVKYVVKQVINKIKLPFTVWDLLINDAGTAFGYFMVFIEDGVSRIKDMFMTLARAIGRLLLGDLEGAKKEINTLMTEAFDMKDITVKFANQMTDISKIAKEKIDDVTGVTAFGDMVDNIANIMYDQSTQPNEKLVQTGQNMGNQLAQGMSSVLEQGVANLGAGSTEMPGSIGLKSKGGFFTGATEELPEFENLMGATIAQIESEFEKISEIKGYLTNLFSPFQDAFTEIIMGSKMGKDALVDMVESFKKQLISLVSSAVFNAFITAISGGLGTILGASGAGKGFLSFLGFADGGITPIMPFADGGITTIGNSIAGIVNQPTLFNRGGGKLGLMGEAGAEAIIPLDRLHEFGATNIKINIQNALDTGREVQKRVAQGIDRANQLKNRARL